jgi:hypothetical protein
MRADSKTCKLHMATLLEMIVEMILQKEHQETQSFDE